MLISLWQFTERAVIKIKLKRPLVFIIISPILLLSLSFAIWHIVFPLGLIESRLEDFFSRNEMGIKLEGLKKGFFYNITAHTLTVYSKTSEGNFSLNSDNSEIGEALKFSNLKARLDLTSLFKMNPSIVIDSSLAGGFVRGNLSLLDRKLAIDFEGIEVSDVGLTKGVGLNGNGILSGKGTFNLNDSRAELRLSIDKMRLRDVSRDIYIPLSLFSSLRGYLEIYKGMINFHSLSFEGKGVYGRIQKAQLRIEGLQFNEGSTLTVMVNSDFPLPQMIDLALLRYKRSPGYYIIPLGKL